MDVVSQFGREAEKYLTSPTHADEAELASFVRLVSRPGGRVIDLATGAGHCAFAFAPTVDEVVACDLTPRMLEVTLAEAARRGLRNILGLLADCGDVPEPAESFDGAICRLAAHHFPRPDTFVQEVWRLLKPGGWFLFVDTVGMDDARASAELDEIETLRDPSHVRDVPTWQWTQWFEATGFEVSHVSALHHRYDIEVWMDRMSVTEPQRSRCRDLMTHSTGPLRDYLQPETDGEGRLSFLLHQVVILATK